jgi:hypothetical protein
MADSDTLSAQYEAGVPETRRRQGRYYTPTPVVEFILNRIGWTADGPIIGKRLIDPACGCGAFTVAAAQVLAERLARDKQSPNRIGETIRDRVFAVDIDAASCEIARRGVIEALAERGIPTLGPRTFPADALSVYAPQPPLVSPEEAGRLFAPATIPESFAPPFDFVVGNPPYRQIYDLDMRSILAQYQATKGNMDLYTAFIELALSLCGERGSAGLVVPNTFIRGQRYANLNEVLDRCGKRVDVYDFGEQQIFNGATVCSAIVIARPSRRRGRCVHAVSLDEERVRVRDDAREPLIFVAGQRGGALLGEVCMIRDVGINYSRKGRGKVRDGDLASRIMYEGAREDARDHPVIRGSDITPYLVTFNNRWLRHDYETVLAEGETVSFGADYFSMREKIVTRQTADSIIAAIDRERHYLARTVHLVTRTPETPEEYSLLFLLAVLNSGPTTELYQDMSHEQGRVFAQVKIGILRKLPLPSPRRPEAQAIEDLARKMQRLARQRAGGASSRPDILERDWEATRREIDAIVARLWGI